MGTKLITAPGQVVTLAELRLHLKLDVVGGVHPDDTLIVGQLLAAQRYAEHYTQTSIGAQTLELALDEFPSGAIQINQGPVTGIVSVKYIDIAGVQQTLGTTAYSLDDYSTPAWVTPLFGTTWPATMATPNAVKVQYLAGTDTVNGAVKSALLLIVGHLYQNRENESERNFTEVPLGAHALLDTLKVWTM